MRKKTIVAIDGPAGAGKSTIAKLLAKRIGADIWSSDGFDAAEKAEAALLERRRREQEEKEEPHA